LNLRILIIYFIFTSNNDVQNSLILGRDINTWLIYVLIFFGLTFIAFSWVWLSGFVSESKSGKSMKQPWE
tara:strand:+ start:160 stop:369 length:210 start_codon:yes stop_codon:yes gene_type:complete